MPQAPRGVYRFREKLNGRWGYYALASTGEILEIMRPRRHETDAEVVWMLATILRLEDRRHLKLVRPRAGDHLASSALPSARRPA